MKRFRASVAGRFCIFLVVFSAASAFDPVKDEIDKIIEEDITHKMGDDILQSIEKKFLADMQNSVEAVLGRIKRVLQNGTTHISDKLKDIQAEYSTLKKGWQKELEACLSDHVNETMQLVDRALHQMVLCGYSLIGQDPSLAVSKVVEMKQYAKKAMIPVYAKRQEVYDMIKVCGHQQDSLRKVLRCVIAKSPAIKSAMMDITSLMIEGVVELTKLVAHGAMHEACLIEVVKTVEDDAIITLNVIRSCIFSNSSRVANDTEKLLLDNNATVLDIDTITYFAGGKKLFGDTKQLLEDNNATVLDVPNKKLDVVELVSNNNDIENQTVGKVESSTNLKEMKTLIRRMLDSNDNDSIDKQFKKKLKSLEKQIDKKYI